MRARARYSPKQAIIIYISSVWIMQCIYTRSWMRHRGKTEKHTSSKWWQDQKSILQSCFLFNLHHHHHHRHRRPFLPPRSLPLPTQPPRLWDGIQTGSLGNYFTSLKTEQQNYLISFEIKLCFQPDSSQIQAISNSNGLSFTSSCSV